MKGVARKSSSGGYDSRNLKMRLAVRTVCCVYVSIDRGEHGSRGESVNPYTHGMA
jgi:hypothetical protein